MIVILKCTAALCFVLNRLSVLCACNAPFICLEVKVLHFCAVIKADMQLFSFPYHNEDEFVSVMRDCVVNI